MPSESETRVAEVVLPEIDPRSGRPVLDDIFGAHWRVAFGLLLVTGVMVRLIGIVVPGTEDIFSWERWAKAVYSQGTVDAFVNLRVDSYPPLIMFLFEGISKLTGPLTRPLIKVVLIAIEFTLAGCLLWEARRLAGAWHWAVVLGLLLLNPALVLLTSMLAYLDVIPALLLVGSLMLAVRQRFLFAGLLYGLAAMAKWQPILFLPLAGVWLAGGAAFLTWRRLVVPVRLLITTALASLGAVLAVLATFMPFVVSGHWGAISHSWSIALQHFQLSANQMNVGWLLTWILHLTGRLKGDLVFFTVRGTEYEFLRMGMNGVYLAFLAILAVGVVRYLRVATERGAKVGEHGMLVTFAYSLVLAYWGYVVLGFGVHENHLALIVPVILLLALWERQFLPLYVLMSVVLFFNLFLFYGAFGNAPYTGGLPGGRGAIWTATSLLISGVQVCGLALYTFDFVVRWSAAGIPLAKEPPAPIASTTVAGRRSPG